LKEAASHNQPTNPFAPEEFKGLHTRHGSTSLPPSRMGAKQGSKMEKVSKKGEPLH